MQLLIRLFQVTWLYQKNYFKMKAQKMNKDLLLEFLKDHPIIKAKYITETVDEDVLDEKKISFKTTHQQEQEVSTYGIDLDLMTTNEMLKQFITEIEKHITSYVFNNFAEKEYTLIDHIKWIKDGLLITSPFVISKFMDNENYNIVRHSITNGLCMNLEGEYLNTKLIVNPYFTWNENRIIWFKNKVNLYLYDIELIEDKNETINSKMFKILYSIRYPEAFLGYLKDEK